MAARNPRGLGAAVRRVPCARTVPYQPLLSPWGASLDHNSSSSRVVSASAGCEWRSPIVRMSRLAGLVVEQGRRRRWRSFILRWDSLSRCGLVLELIRRGAPGARRVNPGGRTPPLRRPTSRARAARPRATRLTPADSQSPRRLPYISAAARRAGSGRRQPVGP